MDRLDVDLVRSAFWPDAHDAHGKTNGSIDDFLAAWLPSQAERQAGQHLVTNHTVDFDGHDDAHTETYLLVAIKNVTSPELNLIGGRYIDHFQRRDGEWRILTRLTVVDWTGNADASDMTDRLTGMHQGARGLSDPSYERPLRRRNEVSPAPTSRRNT